MFVPSFLAAVIASLHYPQGAAAKPPAIRFTTQPQSQTINQNEPFTLTVTTDPADAAIKWQQHTGGGWSDIAGATAKTYSVASQATAGALSIRAVATKGSDSVVSSTATITVSGLLPVFTAQPVLSYFQIGGKLEITGAAASPVTSYQWQKLQADGTTWADVQSDKAGAVFTKNVGATGDEGQYRVMAINADKRTLSDQCTVENVFLYVQNDDDNNGTSAYGVKKIDNQHWQIPAAPADPKARPISTFMRRASAPTVHVAEWAVAKLVAVSDKQDVAPVAALSGRGYRTVMQKAGTAIHTLSYLNLFSELKIVVTGEYTPTFTTQPAATTNATAGSKVELKPVVSGTDDMKTGYTYKWQRLDADNTTWKDVTGQTAINLTIAAIAAVDAGSYHLVVTNGTKTATSATAVINVT